MASKDMVGLRMSSDEIARLDAEARRRGLKRAALIRTCIDETLVDPYQVLEAASQGKFSSEFLHHLVSFDFGILSNFCFQVAVFWIYMKSVRINKFS